MSKKRIAYYIITGLVIIFFVLPFCFTNSVLTSEVINRNWVPPIFYGIMAIASILILIGYCVFFKKKYFWLLLTMISVCICNFGYFALSLSTNLAEAILANKIAYFGNVFLPLFLLITIADACRFRYSKFVVRILFAISCILFIFVATGGYFDLFYKTIEFTMEDGIVHLHKTYGLMHAFYLLYIFSYFFLMVAVIFYSYKKGKLISQKHIISLLSATYLNILLWILERFINLPFEILSLSYVLTSILVIYLYKQLYSFGLLDYDSVSLNLPSEKQNEDDVKDENYDHNDDIVVEDNLANLSDDKLKDILKNLKIETPLTAREIEVAILMIKNVKRKKIAEFLFVTEHTIKFHVSSIFRKTNVTNRNELAELIKTIK